MSNLDNLRLRANQVKTETQESENTADRVGSVLVEIIDNLGTRIDNLEQHNDDSLVDYGKLEQDINQVKEDLNNILDRNRDAIERMVNDLIDRRNFVDGWQAGWNDKIAAYLISVGAMDEYGNTAWSYLQQQFDEIQLAVNKITPFEDENGNPLSIEAIQALIDSRIVDNTAIIDMISSYALTDEERNVLKWFSSGFHSEASDNLAVADVFASMEDVNSAIAALHTEVDDNFVAKAELATMVENAATEYVNTAGFVAESDLDSAVARLFADDGQATAAVSALVENGTSQIDLTADVINTITRDMNVKVKNLLIDNDKILIGSYVDNEGLDNTLGLQLAVGDFIAGNNGGIAPTGKVLRCRFTGHYADIPKIISSQIMAMKELDVSSDTTIKWFNRIGPSHLDGDQYGFSGTYEDEMNHTVNEGKNIHSGTITFSGNTMTITGNLRVTGTLSHN